MIIKITGTFSGNICHISMIKKLVITLTAAAICFFMVSCDPHVAPAPIADTYCDTGNINLPWAMNYLGSVNDGIYGNTVFKTAQEMTDAGVPDVITNQVDFSSEMVIGMLGGCYSGCSSSSPYPISVGTDCTEVIVNYYQPPFTAGPSGPGTVTCMAYWCNNHFLKVKKSSLPIVFISVPIDHDQDKDGTSDRDENMANTDPWDKNSHP